MKNVIVFLLAVVLFKVVFLDKDSVTLGPGVFAPDIPLQQDASSGKSFAYNDYTITPLQKFKIKAKVLSVEYYTSDRGADLSPIDLALGWGRMSDEAVLKEIDISQSGRWYHWSTKNFPIPRREIETHSANMHLVPANDSIYDLMEQVRNGDIVEFSGSLIQAQGTNKALWKSSLTRNDVGAHACELIWVDNFVIHNFN